MGVGVSGWPLARAVSRLGQLGVVSGTALAIVLSRRLQLGDPGGHMRRALEHFPYPAVAQRVLQRYFIPGGKAPSQPFELQPLPGVRLSEAVTELTVVANFAEVYLAKEGHDGLVGVNYLEKIQYPALASLYGAMLAGVDYVLIGAGIPRAIPGILDAFAAGQAAQLTMDISGDEPGEPLIGRLDPQALFGAAPLLKRPRFLAIVSSDVLAATLARKSNGKVEGFIIEGPSAGGHNAPPRARRGESVDADPNAEPIYSERDRPDLKRFIELGLPFWLAGSYGEAGKLAEALACGAAGIQVGTAFAFCAESGLDADLKAQVIAQVRAGTLKVRTDPRASPTGFPFKAAQLSGTLAELKIFQERQRICDLGYLRQPYRKAGGTIGYRCPAEPLSDFLAKGGTEEQAAGRQCLCNALSAAIGLGQPRGETGSEAPLVTAGLNVGQIASFLEDGRSSYSAADVVRSLLEDGR